MTSCKVSKSQLRGSLALPPSKSQTHRALIFAALSNGISTIHNALDSPDIVALKKALSNFGAEFEGNQIKGTNGKLSPKEQEIYVGNSGIALRFLSALSAHSARPITITGDLSIRTQRPMEALIKALHDWGVHASSPNGFAPVEIYGPPKTQNVEVDGRDSQPVSALLISSLFAPHPTTINVSSPGELPWVDLTLNWFKRFDIPFERQGYHQYRVEGNETIPPFSYTVPGDISSAAFPIAAALVTGSSLTLNHVDMHDPQGDKKLIKILEQMGASFQYQHEKLVIPSNQHLRGVEVDINDCIDTITSLAVIACFAEGTTKIKGAAVAKEKECDRIKCITSELGKMGAHITPTDDGLVILSSPLNGADVNSYDDQRMALALMVAGLGAEGTTTIQSTSCIKKTYPTFVKDMKNLGAIIHENP